MIIKVKTRMITMVFICLCLITACGGNNDNDSLKKNKETNEQSSASYNIGNKSDEKESAARETSFATQDIDNGLSSSARKDDLNMKLLAVGMSYAEKNVNRIPEIESVYSDLGYEIKEKTKDVIERQESVSAILIPFQEEFFKKLGEETGENTEPQFDPFVFPGYTVANLRLGLRSRWIDTNDKETYNEDVLLSILSRSVYIESSDWENDKCMLVVYGNKSDPDAGSFIAFRKLDENIVEVSVNFIGRDIIQGMINEFADWINESNWYSKEELNEIKSHYLNQVQLVKSASVPDLNQYMIRSAVDLNSEFCDSINSSQGTALLDQAFDGNSNEFRKTIFEAAKRFNLGAVMTVDMSPYFKSYGLAMNMRKDYYTAEIGSCMSILSGREIVPLPDNWSTDAIVILGDKDDHFYAAIEFTDITDTQFNSSQVLEMKYYFMIMDENQSIMDIQSALSSYREYIGSDTNFSFASPYGAWSEYEGITNLYSVN